MRSDHLAKHAKTHELKRGNNKKTTQNQSEISSHQQYTNEDDIDIEDYESDGLAGSPKWQMPNHQI